MIRSVLSALFALMIALGFAGCGSGDSQTVDTSEHDNWVYLSDAPTVSDTTAYVEADHSITSGQPWGGVTASFGEDGTLSIDAVAGRKKSSEVATWFKTNAHSTATCTAACNSAWPSELNFAFEGTITINGTQYPITIGQGSTALGTNNWWIGGQGWSNPKTVLGGILTPDGKYCVWPAEDTSDDFWVGGSSGSWSGC